MLGTMANMHMSVQMILQHTLRFFVGDSRSASSSRTSELGPCRSAALSVAVFGSTAMSSVVGVGWASIFLFSQRLAFFYSCRAIWDLHHAVAESETVAQTGERWRRSCWRRYTLALWATCYDTDFISFNIPTMVSARGGWCLSHLASSRSDRNSYYSC